MSLEKFCRKVLLKNRKEKDNLGEPSSKVRRKRWFEQKVQVVIEGITI